MLLPMQFTDCKLSLQDFDPGRVCHIFIEESEYNFAPNLVEIIENSGGTPSEDLKDIAGKNVRV